MKDLNVCRESLEISHSLSLVLPQYITGKEAVLQMKTEGSRQWRQMEWIGFWFEHIVSSRVIPQLGGKPGPAFGRTQFDLQRSFVWDLKAHPMDQEELILNDQLAIRDCIDRHKGIGFIIIEGAVEYDHDGSFKTWHDKIKGKTSKYVSQRIARGAPSRIRKTSFSPIRIEAFYFKDFSELISPSSKWIKSFQEGMRNSNGNLRSAKFKVDINSIPRRFQVSSHSLHR